MSAPARASSILCRRCSEQLLGRLDRPGFALDAIDQEGDAGGAENKPQRDHRRHRQHQIETAAACRNAIMVMAAPEIT